MKKIGNLFIIAGLVILVLIIYLKGKTYYEQKQLIKEYTSLTFSEEAAKGNQQQNPENGDAIGILEIPKIALKTPVTEGAKPENIQFAVGHLPSSSSTNELGRKNKNFAIAGHRSYTYGKFFNRLDELVKDDQVVLYAQNSVYTYKVFDKKIVSPSRVDVIYPISGKSVVTLITCHPEYSDEQRLIVFCELISEKVLGEGEIEKILMN